MAFISITEFGLMMEPFKSKCSAYCCLLANMAYDSSHRAFKVCAALPRDGISHGIWNFAAIGQVKHLNMELLHINKMI